MRLARSFLSSLALVLSFGLLADIVEAGTTVTVQEHDTLSKISMRLYGTPLRWRWIQWANAAVIVDSDHIQPGMALNVPEVGAEGRFKVVVEAGDDLGTIAQRYLGHSYYWKKIYKANASILTDPNRLKVGVELVIPGELPVMTAAAKPIAPGRSPASTQAAIDPTTLGAREVEEVEAPTPITVRPHGAAGEVKVLTPYGELEEL